MVCISLSFFRRYKRLDEILADRPGGFRGRRCLDEELNGGLKSHRAGANLPRGAAQAQHLAHRREKEPTFPQNKEYAIANEKPGEEKK